MAEDKYGSVEYDEPPTVKSIIDGGYTQTYMIMKNDVEAKKDGNDAFFRCGNWCYTGQIQIGNLKLETSDIPLLIPTLQKQQGTLRYYSTSVNIPKSSKWSAPVEFMNDALQFVAGEMISEDIELELRRGAAVFPWIDDDDATTYFELSLGNVPSFMEEVGIAACKTYHRELIIISIFCDKSIYFLVKPGEGTQPLLDVRFPDVSQHGQGLHLSSYNDHSACWRKLTLWHIFNISSTSSSSTTTSSKSREGGGGEGPSSGSGSSGGSGGSSGSSRLDLKREQDLPKIKTINASSKNYLQTYYVMKGNGESSSSTTTTSGSTPGTGSAYHDALFRFGSWCYSGRVQLTPALSLSDIPYVIPALRMQQSRLDYLCDSTSIPTNSPFAPAIDYIQQITPFLENQIVESEEMLRGLIDRLTKMGLGESVSKWLEGDPKDSFFEFKIASDKEYEEAFRDMELVASKCYHGSGVISITIIFQHTIYVCLSDGSSSSDLPLLDSRFVDISGKGRGYQIASYSDGVSGWPGLRKVSIWQTVSALETEFKDRASKYAEAKRERDRVGREGGGEAEVGEGGEVIGQREDEQDVERKMEQMEITPSSSSVSVAAQSKADSSSSSSPSLDKASPSSSSFPFDSKSSSISSLSPSSPMSGGGALGLGGGGRLARPHHLPGLSLNKDSNLAKKLEGMRRAMEGEGGEGGEGDIPKWDSTGRPLVGGSGLGRK